MPRHKHTGAEVAEKSLFTEHYRITDTNMQILADTYKMHVMHCGCYIREDTKSGEVVAFYLCKYHATHGNMPKITVTAFYKLMARYGRFDTDTCAMCNGTFGSKKALKAHKIEKHAY
jgi:hypothetical protein